MHVASFWLRGIVQRCQLRCDDSIDSNGSDRKAFEIKGSDGIDSKSSDNQVPWPTSESGNLTGVVPVVTATGE